MPKKPPTPKLTEIAALVLQLEVRQAETEAIVRRLRVAVAELQGRR